MILRRGNHLLRHSSTLQSITSTSSAEAEYYAMTKGAAYALGIQSHYRDWGVDLSILVRSDSSAGLSFSSRRGLGRMRHIQTRYLWLQERVAAKHLRLEKVNGELNPANILTKVLPIAKVRDVCQQLGQIKKDVVAKTEEDNL